LPILRSAAVGCMFPDTGAGAQPRRGADSVDVSGVGASTVLRRLSSLCYFHCDAELCVDFRGLIEGASAFRTVAEDLRWQARDRFSGRQRQRIDMSGVLGRIVFEAPQASA
jgi:hypothetical protein